MTRVFYCSTFFGAVTLSAAIDAGYFGAHDERRLLIVSSNGAVPEINRAAHETPGFETLQGRFDEIVSWNRLIAPLHPSAWSPGAAEVPLLSRLLGARLALGDVTELIVESIAVAPARTIARLVRDCPITVFSDGLMSYGPTRDRLPRDISGRVRRVLYLDLAPPLQPLLLREFESTCEAIPDAAFARVLAELPEAPDAGAARGCPVIVGQYLSAIGILTPIEEAGLHAEMLRALVARGHRHVVFKPHPAAGVRHVRQLRTCADECGVRLTVVPEDVAAEVWFRDTRPDLIVSCFSTALLTAAHFLGLPVAAMGSAAALEQITPYENSNRIPATIVDAVMPRLRPDGTLVEPPPVDLPALVQSVGYCMQSKWHQDLRPVAVDYLRAHGRDRYFKRRRLEAIGLVEAPLRRSVPVLRAGRVIRRAVVRARPIARRVLPRPVVKVIARRS